MTRVLIEFSDDDGERWSTIGVSPNIIDASFQALTDSITYKLLRSGAVACSGGSTVADERDAPGASEAPLDLFLVAHDADAAGEAVRASASPLRPARRRDSSARARAG